MVCLLVICLPAAIDSFTPKVLIKEIPVIKEGKVIEKEKIYYRDKRLELFEIVKIDEDTYVINIRDDKNPDKVWEVSAGFGPQQSGILFHRKKQSRQEYFNQGASVTPNTAGWN